MSGRISSTTVTVLYILAFVLFVQFLAGALLHKYDVYSAFPFSALGVIESTGNYTVDCGFDSLHKDAKSALRRATTPECLQLIADTACANEKGTLYPPALRNLCPAVTDERVAGHYLGCFQDSFDGRLLKGGVSKLKSTNSPRK